MALYIFLGFAIILAISLWFLYSAKKHYENSYIVPGKVINFGKFGFLNVPIVSFITKDNKAVQFQSSAIEPWRKYYTGQNISVVYDPEYPVNARINHWESLYLFPVVLAGFSVFGMVVVLLWGQFGAIIGLVVIATGLIEAYRITRFSATALTTTGTITQANVSSTPSKNSVLYGHEIRFETADGQAVFFKTPDDYVNGRYNDGDTVEVIYDPRSPYEAKVNDHTLYNTASLLVIIGVGILYVSLFIFR